MNSDIFFNVALKEAYKAYKQGEVPVGAVIVKNNRIIAKAHNIVEKTKDCSNHAEILAIKKASKKLKNWRLIDCDLFVTLEPCNMCKGAIELARIENIYYLAPKKLTLEKKNKSYIKSNYYSLEYIRLLKSFFIEKRE